MNGLNPNTDVMAAFAQVFTPKNQFPRWFQPNPQIGQILVQSQDEEDELKARDWSPKPLPGSELPRPALDTQAQLDLAKKELEERMAKFAEQQAEFFKMIEARTAPPAGGAPAVPSGPVVAAVPGAVASGDVAAALVAGGLSDSSDDVIETGPDDVSEKSAAVIVPGSKAKK